jgi:hypothetical protein
LAGALLTGCLTYVAPASEGAWLKPVGAFTTVVQGAVALLQRQRYRSLNQQLQHWGGVHLPLNDTESYVIKYGDSLRQALRHIKAPGEGATPTETKYLLKDVNVRGVYKDW